MHAYLISGTDKDLVTQKINELSEKLGAKIIENIIAKIDDVRSLNNFLKLSIKEPTIILCQNIEDAGIEALNAFLKNLEEPQENLYFILTTSSIQKVLPTIVSRCEVVTTKTQITKNKNETAEKFISATTGERLKIIDKIKDRAEALDFVNNLINTHHWQMHSGEFDITKIASNLDVEINTLSNLKANGNVSLQLTNLVVKLI